MLSVTPSIADIVAAAHDKPVVVFEADAHGQPAVPPLTSVLSLGDDAPRNAGLVSALMEAGGACRTVIADSPARATREALQTASELADRLVVLRLHAPTPLARYARWDELSDFPPPGINPPMLYKLRAALDRAGHGRVGIAVSGTFDGPRIRAFESVQAPVAAYCVSAASLPEEHEER